MSRSHSSRVTRPASVIRYVVRSGRLPARSVASTAGRWFRDVAGWRRFGAWLPFGSPLTLALLVTFFATFQPTADGAEHGVAGLVQRLLVLEVHAWFVAIGWLAYRRGGAESIGIAGRR
ncbi:hypothetical protein [Micromonospora sp. NPDC048830]|uniref:hypothetical protein n=1 Tax=Micromonospora sp. NPDC048830 TaxID=3364257 RepID=UPI00370FABF0